MQFIVLTGLFMASMSIAAPALGGGLTSGLGAGLLRGSETKPVKSDNTAQSVCPPGGVSACCDAPEGNEVLGNLLGNLLGGDCEQLLNIPILSTQNIQAACNGNKAAACCAADAAGALDKTKACNAV